jgi:thiamine-phosphate pyrophosphorylase
MADPLLRIIDANANRAREGLRVMEDIARFALGSTSLTEEVKHLRHDLGTALAGLPADRSQLLASRDAAEDVGATIKTVSECDRAGIPAIAAAAAGRVTEALRSLEEAAKALPAPSVAGAIESLRYRTYTADQRLTAALGAFTQRRQWSLCVLITGSLCRNPWEEVASAAMDGGCDCLQLREKSLEDRELLARARRLVALARPRGVPVIINDRPDVALLAGADGVHLGQTDLSVRDVRALSGSRLLIGVSTESTDQARTAADDGADYLGVGPMFPTTTKDKPRLAGPAYLRTYLADEQLARVPHLAIGGVSPENIADLRAAGARGVAVCSAVISAADPAGVCRALLAALKA